MPPAVRSLLISKGDYSLRIAFGSKFFILFLARPVGLNYLWAGGKFYLSDIWTVTPNLI